jgi:sulfate adenylyltransferase large subunit
MSALALRAHPSTPSAANDLASAERSLLRFITCGSVDDGKSTLIGRLLFEAGAVPEDTLATMRADSARIGNADGALDYSLLVDGLQAEREQGITIDVAYRYFATARRSFIVADTPGHEQYTRNMATGASGADLAIILIDARKGMLAQTRRHSLIVSLVGVKHVVVAINKIDLVGHDQTTIAAIAADYRAAVAELGFESVTIIPVSAREGDNIVSRSPRTPWHEGPTLLGWLEAVDAARAASTARFALPVQWVNRPNLDFRGFAGTIAAGVVKTGDAVLALPSGQRAAVARIVTFDGDLERAGAGQAVTLGLDREIDISRGDVLVSAEQPRDLTVRARETVEVRLFATADRAIAAGDSFLARIGAATIHAVVEEVRHAIDVETFRPRAAQSLQPNDLGLVRLRFDRPVVSAPYRASSALGALILIDRMSNATAAMGVVVSEGAQEDSGVLAFRRAADRTLTSAIGPEWRQDIVPATSWRIGSAMLLGVVVGLLTGDPIWGLAAAGLDAVIRPALRYGHRAFWRRARQARERDAVSDGGGI